MVNKEKTKPDRFTTDKCRLISYMTKLLFFNDIKL